MADATILTVGVTFLVLEQLSFLNYHVTALNNGSHISAHLKLQDNETVLGVFSHHRFWQLYYYWFIPDISATWEHLPLVADGSKGIPWFCIIADFDSTITFFGDSLGPPLDVILWSLTSQIVGLNLVIDSTILSSHSSPSLRHVNELSGSWL